MFDGKKCKLCKECVLIVREEKMQEIDNQASISEADMETSVAAAPSSESDAPSALGTAFRNHCSQHEWCAVEVPELRR